MKRPAETRAIRLNLNFIQLRDLDTFAFALGFKNRNALLYDIVERWLDWAKADPDIQRQIEESEQHYQNKEYFALLRRKTDPINLSPPNDWQRVAENKAADMGDSGGADPGVVPHDLVPEHYTDMYQDLDPEDPAA